MRIQTRQQWKFVLVVLTVLVGAISAVVWKTQSLLTEDKMNFIADSSIKQIAPIRRLVQERLDDHKTKLVRFASMRVAQGAPSAAPALAKNLADFDVISMVQPTDNKQWTPAWIEKGPAISSESWPAGYEQTLLKSLPYAKVKDGEITWMRLSDTKGSPVYAMLVAVEVQNPQAANLTQPTASGAGALPEGTDYGAVAPNAGQKAVLVGFTSYNPLTTVTDDFIGSTNIVYLVDERGYVASHTNKAFLGALFSEDPLVQEIMHSRKSAGSNHYDDLENRAVLGRFEKIDRTNVFAVIETPMATVNALADSHLRTALMTGTLVGFIGLLLAWVVGRGLSSSTGEASSAAKGASATGFADDTVPENWTSVPGVPPAPLPEQSPLALYSEEFTSALKEPIFAVLGHAQLTKVKTDDSEIKSHAESIEREARRATDLVEEMRELKVFADAPIESETMNLKDVVAMALEQARVDLENDEIQVRADINELPVIRGSTEQIRDVFLRLIENSREAMKARQDRFLTIRGALEEDKIILTVADTGFGMSRETKARVFEPFYREFESSQGSGLGLIFVQTALKRLGATCEVDSTPGGGSVFTLKFNVTADEKRAFRIELARREAEAITLEYRRTVAQTEEARETANAQMASPTVAEVPPTSAEKTATESQAFVDSGSDSSAMSLSTMAFLEEDDSEDEDGFMIELGGRKPLPPEKAAELPPLRAAAIAAPLENAVIEEDEDDEPFANVPLGQAAKPQASFSPQGEVSIAMEEPKPSEFKVKIRRPKLKN